MYVCMLLPENGEARNTLYLILSDAEYRHIINSCDW